MKLAATLMLALVLVCGCAKDESIMETQMPDAQLRRGPVVARLVNGELQAELPEQALRGMFTVMTHNPIVWTNLVMADNKAYLEGSDGDGYYYRELSPELGGTEFTMGKGYISCTGSECLCKLSYVSYNCLCDGGSGTCVKGYGAMQ